MTRPGSWVCRVLSPITFRGSDSCTVLPPVQLPGPKLPRFCKHFRQMKPEVVTMPQSFLRAGYVTRDCGKIFHNWHTQEQGDRISRCRGRIEFRHPVREHPLGPEQFAQAWRVSRHRGAGM